MADEQASKTPSDSGDVAVTLQLAYDVLIDKVPKKEHEDRIIDRLRQVMTGVGIPKSDIKVKVGGIEYTLTLRQADTSEAGLFDPSKIGYKNGRPVFKDSNAFSVDLHPYGKHLRKDVFKKHKVQVPSDTPTCHYNVRGQFESQTRNIDHAPSAGAKALGRTLKTVRTLGKVVLVVTIVIDGTELAVAISDDIAKDRVEKAPKTAARIAGRWGGAALGAKALGALGAMAGSPAPGVGNIVGGLLGGIVGGIVGGILGEKATEALITAIDGLPGLVSRVQRLLDTDAVFEKGRQLAEMVGRGHTAEQAFDAAMNLHKILRDAIPAR